MHLAELLIVCLAGLIPGLLLARGAVPALLATNPTIARTLGEVAIDWRVQTGSAVVAVLSAVAASVVPGMRAMRGQASTVLAATASRATGSTRVQRAMVSVEVALCVALLMAGAVVMLQARRGTRAWHNVGPSPVVGGGRYQHDGVRLQHGQAVRLRWAYLGGSLKRWLPAHSRAVTVVAP